MEANYKINCRWSGNYPNGNFGALSFAESSRVALFLSDKYNNNFGFTVEWQEAPFTENKEKIQQLRNLQTRKLFSA